MSLKICACDGMKAAIVLGETDNPTNTAKKNGLKRPDFTAGGM
jgi:hypothetical protein